LYFIISCLCGEAVRIPTLPIPTVLSSYSRIAGLGWEPGYAVSYVSREAGKSRNYFPNMRCVAYKQLAEVLWSSMWHRQPVLIVPVLSYKTGTVEQQ